MKNTVRGYLLVSLTNSSIGEVYVVDGKRYAALIQYSEENLAEAKNDAATNVRGARLYILHLECRGSFPNKHDYTVLSWVEDFGPDDPRPSNVEATQEKGGQTVENTGAGRS